MSRINPIGPSDKEIEAARLADSVAMNTRRLEDEECLCCDVLRDRVRELEAELRAMRLAWNRRLLRGASDCLSCATLKRELRASKYALNGFILGDPAPSTPRGDIQSSSWAQWQAWIEAGAPGLPEEVKTDE